MSRLRCSEILIRIPSRQLSPSISHRTEKHLPLGLSRALVCHEIRQLFCDPTESVR